MRPPWVNRAWHELHAARVRERGLTQRQWASALATAWCLVRREDSLVNAGEVIDQRDMVRKLDGREFSAVIPL